MTQPRLALLFIGTAVAAVAFVLLNAWSLRHQPTWKRLERRWTEDVRLMEASGKLPDAWADVRTIQYIGGTAETRGWLKVIHPPLATNPRGMHRMDVLVVGWEENGKRGALIQYNIEDLKTKNTVSEIGRTLILSELPSVFEEWIFR